jgi:hypothetical protein
VYSRVHPFSLLVDSTLQQMDEALVDGCLAVFPRFKVGENVSLFFLSDFWMVLILNRNIRTGYDYS